MKKNKKIRPPFNMPNGNWPMASWIIDNFPKDYEECDFLDPFCGASTILINKNKSKTETINDLDTGIIQIFRALRDEGDCFINKIKRTTCSDRVFNRELNKEEKIKKDYMDHAFNEFVLRRMSRGGSKKSFASLDKTTWANNIKELKQISKRIQDTYILNQDVFEILEPFNKEDTFLYCDPPPMPASDYETKEFEMSTDEHITFLNKLEKFRGKVLISAPMSAVYRRLPKENWKCIKNKNKAKCLWINYKPQ